MDRELRAQGMTGGSQALRHKVRLWVSLDGAYGAEAREVLALVYCNAVHNCCVMERPLCP